jgi:ketosteroid isomerase-like protein
MTHDDQRDAIAGAVHQYFEVLDALDLDSTVQCFTKDAILECVTDGRRAVGRSEIRAMLAPIIDGSHSMSHLVTALVVDTTTAQCATQQDYHDLRTDGQTYTERTCNFFELDANGRFVMVRFWRG